MTSTVREVRFQAPIPSNPVNELRFDASVPSNSVDELSFDASVPGDSVNEVRFRAHVPAQPVRELRFRATIPADPVKEIAFRAPVKGSDTVKELQFTATVPPSYVRKDKWLILLAYINAIGTFLYQNRQKTWDDLKQGIQDVTLAQQEWATADETPVAKWPKHFDREQSKSYNALVRNMQPKQLTYLFWERLLSPHLHTLYGKDPLHAKHILPYIKHSK